MEVDQSHMQEVYNNNICYLVGVVKELVVIKAILVYIMCSFIPPGSLVPDIGKVQKKLLRVQPTQISGTRRH